VPLRLCLMTVCLSVLNVEPAYAYLDPGTGSILLQALLGTAAAVIGGAYYYWKTFVGFFKRQKKGSREASRSPNDGS
jgi:hypothetical protein